MASETAAIETARLRLRRLTEADAGFMLALLNEPTFLANIGDRGVRTHADAERYLREGALRSYAEHGFGLFGVERRSTPGLVGICGLVRRPGLEDADIGFAFLPQYCGRGYATESAAGVLEHAWRDLGLDRVVAIVAPHNIASIGVLTKLDFVRERGIVMPGEETEIDLFALEGPAAGGRVRAAVDGHGSAV